MEEIKKKMDDLISKINHHNVRYYVTNNPEISDKEFDMLIVELKVLEADYPYLIRADSPTQRVGGAVETFKNIEHHRPMLSLDNTYNKEELIEWLKKCEKVVGKELYPIIIEPKIDGISISIKYTEDGFVASTRGDGKIGDDVTTNIKTVRSLPLSLSRPFDIEYRGEVFIKKTTLRRLNHLRDLQGLPPFKNCRNLTSGTVKTLDPKVASERELDVLLYDVPDFTSTSEEYKLKYIESAGLPLIPYFKCNNLTEVLKAILHIRDENYNMDIDGAVIKIDSPIAKEKLGETSKSPRWAIAYKYEQEKIETRLLNVEWSVGRSQITPVAILEPVAVSGSIVSQATLHNIDQIRKKDIHIGDIVRIEKAGYVIPAVVEPVKEKRCGIEIKIELPTHCPLCSCALQIDESGESTRIFCPNPDCIGIKSASIIHFIDMLEIENIGIGYVQMMLKNKLINSIVDLFKLQPEELANLPYFGEIRAAKMTSALFAVAFAPLSKLIAALGISNVGKITAEDLARKYITFEGFVNANEITLQEVGGIGEKTIKSILTYLRDPLNKELLTFLSGFFVGILDEQPKTTDKLKGISICMTGESRILREDLEATIKNAGGKVANSISKKTNYLLIGSLAPANYTSVKKTKAIELGIKIITEEDLDNLIK